MLALRPYHTCQPPFLDRAGLASFPSPPSAPERVSLALLTRDVPVSVSFASVDSARLRSRATAAYRESLEAARHGLWTSAVVTGGAALEAVLLGRKTFASGRSAFLCPC